jgi:hypothetical protein
MLPIETPIIINGGKEISPRDTAGLGEFGSLDFDAYYVKPTILTQKVYD